MRVLAAQFSLQAVPIILLSHSQQVSRLPDPRNVHEMMDGWMGAMDRYMQYFKYHGICELFHRCPVFALRLGWVLHWRFKKVSSRRVRSYSSRVATMRSAVPIIVSHLCLLWALNRHALLSIVTISDLNVIQFDISSACLHSTFKEEMYYGVARWLCRSQKRNWVWYFKSRLYGLVRARGIGNEELNSHVKNGDSPRRSRVP